MRLQPRPRPALPGVALAASVLLSATIGSGMASAASTNYLSQCAVNLRASASTAGTLVATIATGTTVTASASVSGGSWSASCGGSSVSGSTWYTITAVNGTSTSSLYGKTSVYAATGLFKVAPPPPPPGSFLEGIDVSHWQGTINWTSVAAAGKTFAIMKATESTIYADSMYATWHAAARAVGIRVGAYHFAQPSTTSGDAVAEADWFVAHANLLPGDLNPALDLEVSNGLGTTALQNWVLAWLNEVYAKTGIRPMIYTSPSFWRTYMGDTSAFASAGYTVLWIAHWFVSSPSVPGNNWGGHGWTFWQYDDCGSVVGIGGCVDLDRYNGTDFTKVTYGADFSLAASGSADTSTSASVKQGGSTDFTVTINRTWFTLPVALSFSGLPTGASGSLSVTSTAGTTATLHLSTSNIGTVTPTGTYPITISATSNGLTKTTVASLVVTDGIGPAASVSTPRLFWFATQAGSSTPGRTQWNAMDPSGIASYTVESQMNGGSWSAIALANPMTVSWTANLAFGTTYRYRVRATDGAANVGSWAYGPSFAATFTQDASSSITYSSGWVTSTLTTAYGGALHGTAKAGAWAQYTFTGASFSWLAYRGPNRGSAKVYIDGVYVTTVSLYATTYQSRQVAFGRNWSRNATHTVRIVCVGTAGHSRIDIDGFARINLS